MRRRPIPNHSFRPYTSSVATGADNGNCKIFNLHLTRQRNLLPTDSTTTHFNSHPLKHWYRYRHQTSILIDNSLHFTNKKSFHSCSSLSLQDHNRRNSFVFIDDGQAQTENGKETSPSINNEYHHPAPYSITSSFRDVTTDKIISIVNTLENIPIGSMSDVQMREACQVLNSIAHYAIIISPINTSTSTNSSHHASQNIMLQSNEWDDKQKGQVAWMIFKRLLLEIGCYYDERTRKLHMNIHDNINYSNNSYNDDNHHHKQKQIAHQKSLYLDSKVFHDAIKCMTKTRDLLLINQSDDLLEQLEQYYLKTKSNLLYPTVRSYALLVDAIKGLQDHVDDCNNNSNSNSNSNEFVTRIKRIMERVRMQQRQGNSQVVINSHLYNNTLNALAMHTKNCPGASQLLQDMMMDTEAPLDHISYSIAIKSLLSSNKWLDVIDETSGTTTGKMIEKLFIQMQSHGLGNPNVKTMTPILQALSKEGNPNEISNLIEWMEEMYQTWGWEDIRPNNYHFNTMITALARKNCEGKVRSGSGHLAIEILNKMKTLYVEGVNRNVRPDLITYNAVLHAISKEENSQGTRKKVKSDIGERAGTLLRRMEDGEEGDHIVPDIFSYNAVLAAFMNSATFDAAANTQKLLQIMTEKDIEPDLMSYTICINTLSKCKAKGSAQKAEDLLRKLEDAFANGCEVLKPDVKCYNSVIHAWANSNENGAIERAHKILNEMQCLRKSGKRPDLIPDAISFTSIVSAIAHDSKRRKVKDAQRILDTMYSILKDDDGGGIQLDRVAYNALIHAQSTQSGSADKAEMLLDYMLEQNGPSSIRPNAITFNTVLDAISKSKLPGSAARAEKILNKMQLIYEEGWNELRPDTFSFASVLNAYANSDEPDAAAKAEEILKHMHLIHQNGNNNVIPNTICFATVIKAYSRSRDNDAPQKAEDVLRWMFRVRENGNNQVEPNTIAFTSVCDTWSKSKRDDATKRVENLIEWMKKLSKSGYTDVLPNEYTYNCLLTAIARSKDPKKANNALKVLRIMQSEHRLSVNIYNYNNVLSACAYTHGSTSDRFNAIKIAVAIMEETLEQSVPDDRLNVTFGIFFQACANLVHNESEKAKIEKIIEAVFYKCCEKGQVDSKLLLQLKKASTQQLFLKLFGDFKSFPRIKVHEIPQAWKANV